MIHRASFDSPPFSLLSALCTDREKEREREIFPSILELAFNLSLLSSFLSAAIYSTLSIRSIRGFVLANRSRLSSFVYIQGEDTGEDICRGFGSRDRVRDGFFLFFFLFWKRKRSFNLILSICLLRVKISAGGII